jgi:hypothetical protein
MHASSKEPYSIPSGAQYVILHSKNRRRKSNMCRFDSGKWFWLSIIAQVALVKGSAALCTCQKKKKKKKRVISTI